MWQLADECTVELSPGAGGCLGPDPHPGDTLATDTCGGGTLRTDTHNTDTEGDTFDTSLPHSCDSETEQTVNNHKVLSSRPTFVIQRHNEDCDSLESFESRDQSTASTTFQINLTETDNIPVVSQNGTTPKDPVGEAVSLGSSQTHSDTTSQESGGLERHSSLFHDTHQPVSMEVYHDAHHTAHDTSPSMTPHTSSHQPPSTPPSNCDESWEMNLPASYSSSSSPPTPLHHTPLRRTSNNIRH